MYNQTLIETTLFKFNVVFKILVLSFEKKILLLLIESVITLFSDSIV